MHNDTDMIMKLLKIKLNDFETINITFVSVSASASAVAFVSSNAGFSQFILLL